MRGVASRGSALLFALATFGFQGPANSSMLASDTRYIQCSVTYDNDDHRVVIMRESFEDAWQSADDEVRSRENQDRVQLREEYLKAVQDNLPSETVGLTLDDYRCEWTYHPDHRDGSITNGWGNITTIIQTPNYLRGGKGYAKSASKPEKPGSTAGGSTAPGSSGRHLDKPALVIEKSGPTAAELAAEKHRAVEERNRAAQAKYEAELAEQKRKVEEYERAKEEVARKKAEQQAAAQKAQDAFKAEQAAYAERLLRHQQEVADQQAKAIAQSGTASASSPSGQGGRFQATSQIVDTREAAMAGLMSQPVPGPLSDIQCAEVKMYTPPKWTCWGYYYQDRKPAAGSAQ